MAREALLPEALNSRFNDGSSCLTPMLFMLFLDKKQSHHFSIVRESSAAEKGPILMQPDVQFSAFERIARIGSA